MFNLRSLSFRSGQSLVEVLLAMAIASFVLPALLTGVVSGREGKAQQIQRQQAVALMTEAVEAVRSVREKGWAGFAIDGIYHPDTSSGSWGLVLGTEVVSDFTRSITVSSVERAPSGEIVTSGGTVDPSTKRVTVSVSWLTPRASSVTSDMYLTRYLDNATYEQTTVGDFTGGTLDSTSVTNTSGGEVTLGGEGVGFSDWCNPNLSINPVDLPKSGVANAISAIEGKVFAGTGENASGVSYATVDINNATPPSGSVVNTFNGYKTNSIFGEENYAYLGTDTNSKEVVIVDITTSTPSEAGFFDLPGAGNGDSVYVTGNTGLVTSGSTLYSFDLTSKSGSRSQIGSLGLAARGEEIVVVGNYAYIALDSGSTQLQIVDVSNPGSMSVVGTASVNGQGGKDVFVNSGGTRAYLATAGSSSQAEFFIIDITNKSGSHSPLASFDTNGMDPLAVTVLPGNKAIIVGSNGQEYQVINIANETSPASCGGVDVDTGVRGLASVKETDGDAFSYIITGDASAELKIIEGFAGEVLSGSYESKTFDAGSSAAFNRFTASATVPTGTTIAYQVAVAPAVSGSCGTANFDFIGPDGTGSTEFTASTNPIPLLTSGGYQNPGRCMRYKVIFTTTDPSIMPVLNDITINYSP